LGLHSLCNFSEFLLTLAYLFLKYCAIRIIIMLIMMYFNIILLARSKFTEKNGLPEMLVTEWTVT